MTQFLPSNLLTLFAARDPIPYLPPIAKLTHEKRTTGYSGVYNLIKLFEDPKDTPPPTKYEKREERLDRKRKEKQEQVAYKLEQEIANWDPAATERSTSDAFRTLFVGRINFDTSESKLRREFESFGPIKKIYVMSSKKTGKPRGYAFVEYEHERDMQSAYKHADGKKIDGKRVLVDIERGRTVKGWLPRRLGGGLGGTRRGGPDVNVKLSGREDADRDRLRDGNGDNRDRLDDRRERERSRGRSDKVDRRERDRSRDKGKNDRRDRPDRDKSREKEKNDRIDREKNDREKSRDKDKNDRRDRDKSRDKDKNDRRDRDKSRDKDKNDRRDRDRNDRKRRHRSLSRDKVEKNDKKRDRRGRERDRDREPRENKIKTEDNGNKIRVKDEPADDYPVYDSYGPYDDDNYENERYVKEEHEDGDENHRDNEV